MATVDQAANAAAEEHAPETQVDYCWAGLVARQLEAVWRGHGRMDMVRLWRVAARAAEFAAAALAVR